MSSSSYSVSAAPRASSSSTHSQPPPVPLRSALRAKTSTSTITRTVQEKSEDEEASAMAIALSEMHPPRQSYFEKYPVRAKGSKERLAEATSSTRAQTARERARALSGHYDSLGDEESEPQPAQKQQAYAFPSLDDSADDPGLSTSSSFTPRPPRTRRRSRQTSTTSSKARSQQQQKYSAAYPDRPLSPKTKIVPSQHSHPLMSPQLSRDAGYPFSPVSADAPFFRTSLSSSRTQTTLADPEHDFSLATPKSSIFRADGVMVAAPTSGNGVETMDALVHQMNGGHDASEETDLFSSILNGSSRRPTAVKEKKSSRPTSTVSKKGEGFKMKHHPLYHPPLPEPPKGIVLGSPSRTSDETESDLSLMAPSIEDKENERAKRKTKSSTSQTNGYAPDHTQAHAHSSSSSTRPGSTHRSTSDGTLKSTRSKRLSTESSSFLHHQRQRSSVASRPGSRDQDIRESSSKHHHTSDRHRSRVPREREKDRHRPPREHHNHHHHHPSSRPDGSSDSRPASVSTSAQPSPALEQAPVLTVINPSIHDIIRRNAPALVTFASPRKASSVDHQAGRPSLSSLSSEVPPSLASFPAVGHGLGSVSAVVPPRPKRTLKQPPPSSYVGVPAPTTTSVPSPASISFEEEEDYTGRSSIDSVTAEVASALRKAVASPRTSKVNGVLRRGDDDDEEDDPRGVSVYSPTLPPGSVGRRNLRNARSFGGDDRLGKPSRPSITTSRGDSVDGGYGSVIAASEPQARRPFLARTPISEGGYRPDSMWSGTGVSVTPSTPNSTNTFPASFMAGGSSNGTPGGSSVGGQDPIKLELAQFLRSPRLTRLLTLRRPPHAGLTVSMADVGSPTGHPVIVYLGLGCVRYLIALYDEMAEALNLRLVCVDRWGLGRTGEPKDPAGRGLLEWASVIEEVADELGLERFSVMGHSAGAPYALAGVLKWGHRRVIGSVHLLAPWVSMSVDGGYKWLKYVPNGIIKTAQAAEWKVQGWMLGKPPTITYSAIGYDATTGTSTHEPPPPPVPPKEDDEDFPPPPPLGIAAERSSGSTSEYDDLADFKGKYGSDSTLELSNGNADPSAAIAYNLKGKKKPVKSILSLFNNTNGPLSPGVSSNSTRSSRTNSLSGSVATLPAQKTPKLKGLKSLSSLRNEASASMVPPQDAFRRTSEPTTPSLLPRVSELTSSIASTAGTVTLPAHVGLGIGLDEEMLQWSSRLQMLEEMAVPSTDGTVAGPPRALSSSAAAAPRASTASRTSTEGRRSISLTSRTYAGSPLMVPPVPPLPSPNLRDSTPSPNPDCTRSKGASTARTNKTGMSLTNALLRASHAESLKGGTADLLAILERDSKPWGFSYADVRQGVKVWYGDRDEKIAIGSVHWMERVMKDCTVQIVKGGNHNLMTNADVVVEVLESVAKDWAAATAAAASANSRGGSSSFGASLTSSGSLSSFTRRRGRV